MPARVVNFGSINIDYVYAVAHFLRGGETLAASSRAVHAGGKGLNQSTALAHAGLDVAHAGMIGGDGVFLKGFLEAEGVDVSRIAVSDIYPTGHTVIQVAPDGENSILYFAGANKALSSNYIDEVLADFGSGDFLVLQNETNAVGEIIEKAARKGLKTVFSPAPYDASVQALDLSTLYALILNRTEACGILGLDDGTSDAGGQALSAEAMLTALAKKCPNTIVIVTLGSAGAAYRLPDGEIRRVPVFEVPEVVDTTGAGDTFTGFAVRALARYAENCAGGAGPFEPDAEFFLDMHAAAEAAALSVMKPGAAESIPRWSDLRFPAAAREALLSGKPLEAVLPIGAESAKTARR